jgi:hypothetical protein
VKQAIEVAQLVNGATVSIRTLSGRDARRAALAAAGMVLGVTLGAAALTALIFVGTHRVVHAPSFVALWSAVLLLLAVAAGRRAHRRAGRYVVGADIDDDAFAAVPRDLVRHARCNDAEYELSLGAGMVGVVETERGAMDVGALVRGGTPCVPLAAGTRAELQMGTTTFIVRVVAQPGRLAPLPRGSLRPFARRALVPAHLVALVAFLGAVPEARPLGEADMKSAIPADATPWEVEKMLRQEAQLQARTLHACFDTLPMACQRAGYVGVGLSLSRAGEIRSSWIARSTYGKECPVEACMSNVISTWFFEPLPESMRIVLPVQVLRTEKPLPPVHAALIP